MPCIHQGHMHAGIQQEHLIRGTCRRVHSRGTFTQAHNRGQQVTAGTHQEAIHTGIQQGHTHSRIHRSISMPGIQQREVCVRYSEGAHDTGTQQEFIHTGIRQGHDDTGIQQEAIRAGVQQGHDHTGIQQEHIHAAGYTAGARPCGYTAGQRVIAWRRDSCRWPGALRARGDRWPPPRPLPPAPLTRRPRVSLNAVRTAGDDSAHGRLGPAQPSPHSQRARNHNNVRRPGNAPVANRWARRERPQPIGEARGEAAGQSRPGAERGPLSTAGTRQGRSQDGEGAGAGAAVGGGAALLGGEACHLVAQVLHPREFPQKTRPRFACQSPVYLMHL